MRLSSVGCVLLDDVDLPCVRASVERWPEVPLMQYSICARPVSAARDEMEELLDMLERTLQRGERFTVLWDLRTIKLPSRAAMLFAIDWMAQPQIAVPLDEVWKTRPLIHPTIQSSTCK